MALARTARNRRLALVLLTLILLMLAVAYATRRVLFHVVFQ